MRPLRELLAPGEKLWLAGGPVRDLLLQRPLHDWDFATPHHALAIARRAADRLGGAYYVLDAERHTGRAIVTDPQSGHLLTLDFALLRGDSLGADLRLRDFTVNAMALTLQGELVDPTGGLQDLQARLLRLTHPGSLQADPVRMLRAVRQAISLDFRLEATTRRTLQAQAALITTSAAERVRDEVGKMLAHPDAAGALALLAEVGLLPHVLPELAALQSTPQTAPHYLPDVWQHTLASLAALKGLLALLYGREIPATVPQHLALPRAAWEAVRGLLDEGPWEQVRAYLAEEVNAGLPRAELLAWGMLFHDVGKAATLTRDEEDRTHFYGHAEQGGGLARARLAALHFPNRALDFVVTQVATHMRLLSFGDRLPGRRAIYRFYRDTEDAGVAIVLLTLADRLAVWGPHLELASWQLRLQQAQHFIASYFTRRAEVIAPPPLLTGHDLLRLGVPQGPAIGALLAHLQEAQASGEVQDRAAALAQVRQQARELGLELLQAKGETDEQ